MRNYIIDFMNKQKPSLIYRQEEKHGLFSFIWRVWLSQSDEILSLFVVYTPISFIFSEPVHEINRIGTVDDSFYGKLSRMIKVHNSIDEAMDGYPPNLSCFIRYFLYTCEEFVGRVRLRNTLYNGCQLLHFDCIDSRLGIFSVLFEAHGMTENCILFLGRKNFVNFTMGEEVIAPFFDYLFEGKFDIVWWSGDD